MFEVNIYPICALPTAVIDGLINTCKSDIRVVKYDSYHVTVANISGCYLMWG